VEEAGVKENAWCSFDLESHKYVAAVDRMLHSTVFLDIARRLLL